MEDVSIPKNRNPKSPNACHDRERVRERERWREGVIERG